ncbi:hypothetical protein F511_20570 [Dorcoceras hygrometricum]|uniref:Uncharacterized protein n=1 Tax=Dorcoceras hygrometricum TaxID=472368 RepID=A0A2Z7D2M3_9LAMI|nr:hypothetical protein F511_20570 [Dorcoceras hygrometricum]
MSLLLSLTILDSSPVDNQGLAMDQDFLRIFAQGLACHSFVDSVIQRDLGDVEEVVLTDVEEVDLVSSDVYTVYRSPSPPSPGVDSLEHDLRFALGPAIFSQRYDDVISTDICKWLNLVYRDKSLNSKELFIHLLQEEICR